MDKTELPSSSDSATHGWAAMLGVAGMAAAAMGWLLGRQKLNPRFLALAYGAEVQFVAALTEIHAGNFGLARHLLAIADHYADQALELEPLHTLKLPSLPYADDYIVLRHGEDLTLFQDWLHQTEGSIERVQAALPGAIRCDICSVRVAEPNERYCSTCWANACKVVVSQDAVKDRLTALLIEADLRKEERKKQDAEAKERLAALRGQQGQLDAPHVDPDGVGKDPSKL